MKIEYVNINNFKGFSGVIFSPNKNINVFIGNITP